MMIANQINFKTLITLLLGIIPFTSAYSYYDDDDYSFYISVYNQKGILILIVVLTVILSIICICCCCFCEAITKDKPKPVYVNTEEKEEPETINIADTSSLPYYIYFPQTGQVVPVGQQAVPVTQVAPVNQATPEADITPTDQITPETQVSPIGQSIPEIQIVPSSPKDTDKY